MFMQKGFTDANAAVNIDAFPQGQASILPFWLPTLWRPLNIGSWQISSTKSLICRKNQVGREGTSRSV